MSRSRPGETVNYEDVRDQIEQKLLGERVDKLLDAWLKETRSRTKIKFREEAFK